MAGNWVTPRQAKLKNKERTMKAGLNRADVAKFHKLLKQGHKPDKIAKYLHTSVEVLRGLTPEKMAAAKDKATGRADQAAAQKIANRQAADVLAETAAKVMGGGGNLAPPVGNQPTLDPTKAATAPPAMGPAPTQPGTPAYAGDVGKPTGPKPIT